jgi:hypothetical protein
MIHSFDWKEKAVLCGSIDFLLDIVFPILREREMEGIAVSRN